MVRIGGYGYEQIAVFAILGFLGAVGLMLFEVVGGERELAVRACFFFVELFLVLFLEIDVIHFSADVAAFDVASAVAEVCADFAFRERLETVVAAFHGFCLHS